MMTQLEVLESRRLLSSVTGNAWPATEYQEQRSGSAGGTTVIYAHSEPSNEQIQFNLQLPPTVNPNTTVILIIAPDDVGARAMVMRLPAWNFQHGQTLASAPVTVSSVQSKAVELTYYIDPDADGPAARASEMTAGPAPVDAPVLRAKVAVRRNSTPTLGASLSSVAQLPEASSANNNLAAVFATRNLISRARAVDDAISAASQLVAVRIESEAPQSLTRIGEIGAGAVAGSFSHAIASSMHLSSDMPSTVAWPALQGAASMLTNEIIDPSTEAIPAAASAEIVMNHLAGGAVRQVFHFAHMGLPANWLNDAMANLANDMASMTPVAANATSPARHMTTRSAWMITAGALAVDAAVIVHYSRKKRNTDSIYRRATTRLTAARN